MNVIEVNNLTKIYRLYRSPGDRLREMISMNGTKFHREFYALNDVSFCVEKGKTVGIIGENGSGKSTLLKIICGVIQKTSGSVSTSGRIASLLELGAGFNPEFTGRENVYMNGALNGFSREEMERRLPHIEAFAEIGEFLDQPVKTYSSGMSVRLAFAAAVHVDAEILIIDEAIAAGDALFQARCFANFEKYRQKGVTILLVTHNLNLITSHCDSALLLKHGNLVVEGSPKVAVDEYRRLISLKSRKLFADENGQNNKTNSKPISSSKQMEWRGMFEVNLQGSRYGNKKAEILEAGIFCLDHQPEQILERGQPYLIKVKIRYNDTVPEPIIIAYVFRDTKGTILCGTNTFSQKVKIGPLENRDVVVVMFRQIIRLNPGKYILSVGVDAGEHEKQVVCDHRWDYLPVEVISDQVRHGHFDPEATIEWSKL